MQNDILDDHWLELEREWKTTFLAIRKAAIDLLQFSAVRSSVGFAYPLIVVDEFQDCEDTLLELVGLLSLTSSVLVAADDFQHLSTNDGCPACQWLQQQEAEVNVFSGNRRTNKSVLHETAAALREGRTADTSIEVFPIDGHALVAWDICSRFAWNKIPSDKSKVLISPVRPSSSSWVQGVLDSLEKGFEEKWKFHPRPFRWERGEEDQFQAAADVVTSHIASNQHIDKAMLQSFERSDQPIVRIGGSQGRRLTSVRGENGLATSEFFDILRRASHSASAFRHDRHNARISTTIHGAKNREFDYVFIVWPFQVKDEDLLKRKLLYNAVTRAREGAVLFVQGGEKRIRDDAVLALLKCGVVKKKKKQPTHKTKKVP